jgi:HlyD family secretion protein
VREQGKSWPIKVERIYPQIKNGTFVVDFDFVEKAPTELLPGQTIQGKISFDDDNGAKAATVIYLPVGTYLERSGGSWVFVLTDDGRSAVRRKIKVGRRNPEQIEVLDGLSAGERFISSDYTGLDTITRVDIR